MLKYNIPGDSLNVSHYFFLKTVSVFVYIFLHHFKSLKTIFCLTIFFRAIFIVIIANFYFDTYKSNFERF